MKDLAGKVAFITGGASGVAFGQAKVFAEEAGMKVAIADIRKDALDEAMAYFAGKDVTVHPVHLDLTDREAYAAAADEVESVLGPVQLLLNTAGVSQFGPLKDATYGDWDWQMSVNFGGLLNGVQTFMQRMIAHGQGGHIVNCASMSAFVALPHCGIYTTTKFAVRGLSESLRAEMGEHNIGVSLLCPGAVNTNIHRAVETRPEEFGTSGYYGKDENVMAGLKKVIEDGFDPVDLGRIVREAVEADRFWILPYPEFIGGQETRNAEIIAAMGEYKDHPDTARRAAIAAARGDKMPGS